MNHRRAWSLNMNNVLFCVGTGNTSVSHVDFYGSVSHVEVSLFTVC